MKGSLIEELLVRGIQRTPILRGNFLRLLDALGGIMMMDGSSESYQDPQKKEIVGGR